ncbi:hypothetical protein [Halobacillus sp. Marseille-Q1614]|uniref:hypothetical protein n=1 Tax=Halobacillus sp. Marseille-Q1614 TaxID=2709134 RepID=UPI00157115F5|nr:hypothetical protein [Halobacillus sp. Marseille-Q1614]
MKKYYFLLIGITLVVMLSGFLIIDADKTSEGQNQESSYSVQDEFVKEASKELSQKGFDYKAITTEEHQNNLDLTVHVSSDNYHNKDEIKQVITDKAKESKINNITIKVETDS